MDAYRSLLPGAILFDLDNTLCTFVDAKQAACNAVVELIGAGSGEELFSYFLRPKYNFEDHAHIVDFLSDINLYSEDLAEKAGKVYDEVKLDTIALYPGVDEILDTLTEAGVKIAVVTDAFSAQAELRMHKLGIDSRFPVLVTPDRSGQRKPNHASFILAMKQLEVTPSETWVVGDSLRREMIPGLELGLTTVFARYGDWIQIDMPEVKPDHILDQFSDLMNLPGLCHLQVKG
jgi:putative hydrolase of the HAD superfamily